jgi:carbonic anhydrase/acetyltransferase-like protein (isoleucine patch superfamily)
MAIIRSVNGKTPEFPDDCWMADTAVVLGDVQMGHHCTIWFGAVVRGDVHWIKIGDNTNIQDNATIHCTYQKAPTSIGSNVSIGHNAIVHGCTLEDHVLIGMGAIVMDHAVVKSGAIVAAGAVVLENTVVEENCIYAGVPAKKVKVADEKNVAMMERIAGNYIKYASWFREEEIS